MGSLGKTALAVGTGFVAVQVEGIIANAHEDAPPDFKQLFEEIADREEEAQYVIQSGNYPYNVEGRES